MPAGEQNDPRVHFAAERTFLAWIRTGLALMGFGFVVARFGLFLRELAATRGDLALKSSGMSLGFGTALIIAGVVVNVASTVSHVRQIDQLKRGTYEVGRPSFTAIAVALMLAVVGLVMAGYLLVR
jgi:inner membrane protein YidH